MVQREAAFLIARATEEFVHRIAEAAQRAAARERRTTVQAKDLGACPATPVPAGAVPTTGVC